MNGIRVIFRKCLIGIFCIVFICSQAMLVYAATSGGASGGGGGEDSSSVTSGGASSGGGGYDSSSTSRSSASGGGGGEDFSSVTSGSASSGGGGGYDSSSISRSSGSGGGGYDSSSTSRSSASGGGGGEDFSSVTSGGASSGGGGGAVSSDPTYYDPEAWESINDYYDYLDNLNNRENNILNSDINSTYAIPGMTTGSYGSGGGSGIDDNTANISDLAGYVPTTRASVSGGSDTNEMGVLVTNGVDSKFIVTQKNGVTTSEYLKDWAVLTTTNGSKGWYHFDDKGSMTKGFLNDGGYTYYLNESGANAGMLAVGTVNIKGIVYNFSDGTDGLPYGALKK